MIFGTGKGADMATRYFNATGKYAVAGYAVDRAFYSAPAFRDKPVATTDEMLKRFPKEENLAFVPLGASRMNAARAEKYAELKALGYRFASFIHPSNPIDESVEIGENCLILEHQSINMDVRIGNNVVMWSGCQVGDRSVIEDHVFMAAHVAFAGDSVAGERSYFGSNSTVGNGVKVGKRCFIGANALIADDTQDGAVHVVQPTPAIGIDSSRFVKLIRHPI